MLLSFRPLARCLCAILPEMHPLVANRALRGDPGMRWGQETQTTRWQPSHNGLRLAYALIVGFVIVWGYMHSHVDQVVACWQTTTMPGRTCRAAWNRHAPAAPTTFGHVSPATEAR